MTHAPLLALLLLAAACGGTQAYVPPGVLADLDEAEAQTDDVDDIDVNSETEPIPLEENEVDDDVTEVVDVAELEDVVEAIDLVELPDDEPEGEMNEEEAEIEIELTGRGACWIDNDCRSGEKCADAGAEAGVCYREPPSAQTMKVYRDQEEWNTIDGKQKWDKSLHVCNASASSSACFDGPDFEEIDSSTSPTNLLGYIRFFGFEAACGQTYVDLFTERDGAGNPTNLDCSSNHLRPATVPDCAGRDGWLRGSAVHEWNHLRDGQPYTRCYVFFEGIESGRPSIPTGRRLIFKATAASSGAPVRDTYQYNIYIKPDDAVTADRGTQKDGYRLEINVISKPSYNLIPTTAGLASGIDAERGMLAGTLRDCNGLRIKGGSVGGSASASEWCISTPIPTTCSPTSPSPLPTKTAPLPAWITKPACGALWPAPTTGAAPTSSQAARCACTPVALPGQRSVAISPPTTPNSQRTNMVVALRPMVAAGSA